MFTTAKQAVQTTLKAAMQHATAFGLAAVVTLSILASVNRLAITPAADSLLASSATQFALVKAAAKS